MKVLNTLFFSILWWGVSAQVGIGTTTPSNDLDVEGSGAAATAIDINNTSTGDPKINLQISGTTTFSIGIDNSDADKLKIGTTAVETSTRLTIDASGNCGINNSSPTATLDVDGSAIFNESSNAKDFRIESDANTHHFYVDGTNNEIGVNTSTPNSTLDIQGSLGYKINTITAATTLAQTHNVVLCNTGPYTVTLPAAASNSGKVYYLKNIDSDGDIITLDGNASETIDGYTTYLLNLSKHSLRIICDGSNWHILEEAYTITGKIGERNCDGSLFTWNDVSNPTTGKTWMDRNLGAQRVASSSADANSYGDLYQWGRLKDGHQCRTSSTTATTSTTDVPGNATFITCASNWRSTTNDNLWQGVSGVNNPCPSGYRVPTQTELDAELTSWSTPTTAGAFASPLKLPATGIRFPDGTFFMTGAAAGYWASTVSGTFSRRIYFYSASGSGSESERGHGYAVRCIKN